MIVDVFLRHAVRNINKSFGANVESISQTVSKSGQGVMIVCLALRSRNQFAESVTQSVGRHGQIIRESLFESSHGAKN
jgi:hypothetical protein